MQPHGQKWRGAPGRKMGPAFRGKGIRRNLTLDSSTFRRKKRGHSNGCQPETKGAR